MVPGLGRHPAQQPVIQDFAAIALGHPSVPSLAEPGRVSPSGPQTPAQIRA